MSHLDITTTKREDGVTIKMVGSIDRYSDFSTIMATEADKLFIDLRGVQRITSGGVQLWAKFVNELTTIREIELHACSSAFVKQLNMVEKSL